MILTSVDETKKERRIPRESGDDPFVNDSTAKINEYSPRERG